MQQRLLVLPFVTRVSTSRGAGVLVGPMRTPVSGDRVLGCIVKSPGLVGNMRVFTARQADHWEQVLKHEKEKIPELEDVLLFFRTNVRHCVDPSREARTPWQTQCVICTRPPTLEMQSLVMAHRTRTRRGPLPSSSSTRRCYKSGNVPHRKKIHFMGNGAR